MKKFIPLAMLGAIAMLAACNNGGGSPASSTSAATSAAETSASSAAEDTSKATGLSTEEDTSAAEDTSRATGLSTEEDTSAEATSHATGLSTEEDTSEGGDPVTEEIFGFIKTGLLDFITSPINNFSIGYTEIDEDVEEDEEEDSTIYNYFYNGVFKSLGEVPCYGTIAEAEELGEQPRLFGYLPEIDESGDRLLYFKVQLDTLSRDGEWALPYYFLVSIGMYLDQIEYTNVVASAEDTDNYIVTMALQLTEKFNLVIEYTADKSSYLPVKLLAGKDNTYFTRITFDDIGMIDEFGLPDYYFYPDDVRYATVDVLDECGPLDQNPGQYDIFSACITIDVVDDANESEIEIKADNGDVIITMIGAEETHVLEASEYYEEGFHYDIVYDGNPLDESSLEWGVMRAVFEAQYIKYVQAASAIFSASKESDFLVDRTGYLGVVVSEKISVYYRLDDDFALSEMTYVDEEKEVSIFFSDVGTTVVEPNLD